MPSVTIPPETSYSDIERDFIDNEPPGLLPGDQTSVWGQVRKVFADYLQVLADQLSTWYTNLDPGTSDVTDMRNWENELGIPVEAAGASIQQRQAFALARMARGPFTRSRRAALIEFFIVATFGNPLAFDSFGLALTPGGLPLFNEIVDVSGTYEVIEDIPDFSYEVRVLDSLGLDIPGLTRELDRITPAGIIFTVNEVPAL
jgi:hypothetical protein